MLKSKADWRFIEEKRAEKTDSIIDYLLMQNGLYEEEEIERFLQPSIAHVQSAKHFSQIERVKDRIEAAIARNEKIVIYGDYDADGVTATTIMIKVLRRLGAQCTYYIPDRFTEGYGLNSSAIEILNKQKTDLIITVDNGIAAIEEVAYAKELGIDIIITDHHEIQQSLPDAYAIVHPMLSDTYSFKELAGVGVAWQLASYLLEEQPTDLLYLVAIGTVADLVPLIGENRDFVYEGLQQLEQCFSIGIKELISVANLKPPFTSRDIAFGLGPRLNAVGRLQNASLAVELLLTEDVQEAREMALEIDELNRKRQQIAERIVKEAKALVDPEDSFIILSNPDWHEGVLGIAASRLVNEFHRPVMLLKENIDTEELKGSARSVEQFNLFDFCMEIHSLFISFGGHSQAAGMTFKKENLEQIKTFLNDRMARIQGEREWRPTLTINRSITLSNLDEQFVLDVEKLSPFGMENEEPLFLLKAIPKDIRQIGQDDRHLKLQFSENGQIVEAIGFHFGAYAYYISKHTPIKIVGHVAINEWNGRRTVQMVIKDLAIDEWQLFDYRGKQHLSYIEPFINHFEGNVLVCNDRAQWKNKSFSNEIHIMTYDMPIPTVKQVDVLYICDLPEKLADLINLLETMQPSAIHLSYQSKNNAFFEAIPNRKQFAWVYKYLYAHSPIYFSLDIQKMVAQSKMSRKDIIFILQVFSDLNFIEIKANEQQTITLNKAAKKTDLENSPTYQHRLEQEKIEKILYYSRYNELKNWFLQYVDCQTREESVHGV